METCSVHEITFDHRTYPACILDNIIVELEEIISSRDTEIQELTDQNHILEDMLSQEGY